MKLSLHCLCGASLVGHISPDAKAGDFRAAWLQTHGDSGCAPVGYQDALKARRRQTAAERRARLRAVAHLGNAVPRFRTHGSSSTYRHGCRCEPCRVAHREHTQAYRVRLEALAKTGQVSVQHGTDRTYNDFRCRCEECRTAHTDRLRRNRERARAAA